MLNKKIVLAIFTLQGSGAERFVLTLAKAFLDLGYEPHIIIFKNVIELPVPAGVKLHVFPYQALRILPKKIRRRVASKLFDQFVLRFIGQPSLILSNLYPVDFILSQSALENIHFVIHNTTSKELGCNDSDTSSIDNTLAIYDNKSCVSVSDGVEQDLLTIMKGDIESRVIHNPVDIDLVRDTALEFTPEQVPYILHIGKFKEAKRHDILLRAYAHSQVEYPLVLIGKGPLEEEIRALSTELGIAEKVLFLGFKSNPYPYINNAELMVVSSDFEGFSIAILEAVALTTPIVSTDCPSGPNELLEQHQLVSVGDYKALGEKMATAIENKQDYIIELDQAYLPVEVAKKYLALI
ncbi:glycosyltransferase [Leucothrix arctica]|uniref:Glycosyltransferase n=1 Tax=Leucothrix arctica TaxID=1481894 RepID=A0A317C8H1_9GAMM|nr:glycosyltransferase [Leucothrix arctica]PWQ94629.1 glycosyltransferase [Leucothrix arctica]